MDQFETLTDLMMPFKWTCIRCGKEFPNLPDSEKPEAAVVLTDAKTGWQSPGGDICRQCVQHRAIAAAREA